MNEIKKSRYQKRAIIFFCTIFILIGVVSSGWLVWSHDVSLKSPMNNTVKTQKTKTHHSKSKIKTKFSSKKSTISDQAKKEPTKKSRQPSNHNEAADGWAYPTEVVRQQMKEPLDPNKPKTVFLTFDDGPSTNNTPKILSILEQNNVHATFF